MLLSDIEVRIVYIDERLDGALKHLRLSVAWQQTPNAPQPATRSMANRPRGYPTGWPSGSVDATRDAVC